MATRYYSNVGSLVRLILGNIIIPIISCISATDAIADSVTLAWDPNPSPDVAGYLLYYSTAVNDFTHEINVGKATTISVGDLTEGQTYFFAVSAYTASAVKSVLSNEISYTIPFTKPPPVIAQSTPPPAPATPAPAATPRSRPTPRRTRLLKRWDGMEARRRHGPSLEAAAYAEWCRDLQGDPNR